MGSLFKCEVTAADYCFISVLQSLLCKAGSVVLECFFSCPHSYVHILDEQISSVTVSSTIYRAIPVTRAVPGLTLAAIVPAVWKILLKESAFHCSTAKMYIRITWLA